MVRTTLKITERREKFVTKIARGRTTTHIRVEKELLAKLRADRRRNEKTDSEVIARLMETQKRVDVIGLKNGV